MTTMKETMGKGILGVAAPVAGAVISRLAEWEAWLRVASLLVGITVGVLTGISIVRNWKKK